MEGPRTQCYTILKIVDRIKAFYAEYKYNIGSFSNTSFRVKSGVRQGCVMPALLFIITVDWVMRSSLSENITGITWTLFSNLEDLDYPYDLPSIIFRKHICKEKLIINQGMPANLV